MHACQQVRRKWAAGNKVTGKATCVTYFMRLQPNCIFGLRKRKQREETVLVSSKGKLRSISVAFGDFLNSQAQALERRDGAHPH